MVRPRSADPPRDEIDRETYGLFDLEKGVPTDAYELKEAVADGFLVPSKSVTVPLKFLREGIKYENLSEEEKEQWDAKEWSDDGSTPDFVENFVVRSKRRLVEKYGKPEAWKELEPGAFAELAENVAGLPSELEPEDEEAKRFDLLILNLQLAVLRVEPAFKRLSDQVKAIAGLLEEKSSIPMVHEPMPLIQDLQTDEWWQDETVPMLESVRRRLRALVKLGTAQTHLHGLRGRDWRRDSRGTAGLCVTGQL